MLDLWSAVFYIAVALLIAVVGYVLGRAIRHILDSFFRRTGLNDWFRSFNIGRALLRSGYTAGEFFGSVAAWVVYIVFFLLALAYIALNLGYQDSYALILSILYTYVYGFVKFFIISIFGFILVDGFVEYIYKGALSKSEVVVGVVAEYVRIILYLVVITFALEQGGINVSTLSSMLTPITWALAAALVAVLVAESVKKK
ncbi:MULTISPECIES: mechanosensitive ion channel family protein [Pyrobaculum]|uniref:Uncharacterized protein n=2 Tax=Pyrobaculum arsenaticum TaxID=121277 RepID=A4WIH1_PYRAR|nr:hypothetical protein [Pyrobaculum arsenaticum]ABP50188.1 conserved hypothetical protein [Pyrobaculum arsenaticum DSM 13514]MCY0889918.1 hypothetical protein [Pyrobaculum arsenaticum]NYR14874.1 hypothetical protein [Pyrobaculum arsenaticum]